MEVTNKCAALLCNKEVLSVLQSYANEQKKNKRSDQNLSTITYETLKYLNDTPAAVQTPESIGDVLNSLKSYGLTKAEKLQIVNLRPTTAVEMALIMEESEERVTEEQIDDMLSQIQDKLPAPPEDEEEEDLEDESGNEQEET